MSDEFVTIKVLNEPIRPMALSYCYGGKISEFGSHHARFMLDKAVMVLQHKCYKDGLDSYIHRGGKLTAEQLFEHQHCTKALTLAAKCWWYEEVQFLVENYLHEVLAQADINREKMKLGEKPYKNWELDNEVVELPRFQK